VVRVITGPRMPILPKSSLDHHDVNGVAGPSRIALNPVTTSLPPSLKHATSWHSAVTGAEKKQA
jgi:hypothetical protein